MKEYIGIIETKEEIYYIVKDVAGLYHAGSVVNSGWSDCGIEGESLEGLYIKILQKEA